MISFSQTGGTSGITTISVSATSTQNTADTVSNYTLSNENGFEMPMPVVQRAFIPVAKYITITPSVLSSPFSGGYKTITINSNDDWSIDSDEWITISITGGTSGSTIVPVMIEENTGTSRNGTIKCACLSDHLISASTIVNQEGSFKPYINLGYYVLSATSESVTTSVTVSSNISWNVITDSRWVTVNTLSGNNDGSVSFTIAENTSEINREGSITVLNTEYDIYADLVIRQSASEQKTYIFLSPTSFNVEASGSSGNVISVSANCDYDIAADVNWITLSASSGSGNGSVSFATSATSETVSSIGNIEFSNSALSRYVSVERAGVSHYLSASTNSITLDLSIEDSYSLEVYSDVDWIADFDSEERNWLVFTPTSGSGNGTIRVSAASGLTSKSGTMVLRNIKYGLNWNISVVQEIPFYSDRILYTTTGNTIINPYTTTGYGANIISNTYDNGQGVILFDGDVTTIPEYAFGFSYSGRNQLETIVIPKKVTSIGRSAFNMCKNLTEIKMGNSITTFGDYAFGGNNKIKHFSIPNSVTSIGDYCFAYNHYTTGYTIGSGLTSLSYRSFSTNDKLTSISIPNNIKTIGTEAFELCSGITEIILGSSVEEINDRAFEYTRARNVYSYNPTAPTLIGNPFMAHFYAITIHYPIGSDYSSWENSDIFYDCTFIADL